MTFKQVRDWLQQCAKPEALAKLGTQTSNIRLTLAPTTAKETYARKYYSQKITLHHSMDAKWGDRTKDNVPKRTVSCAQKVVCSNHYGYVFVATGTSILCLDQATFKQHHTTFEWTCNAPQVQCDNLSDLRMDVSEGPQLCLVVSQFFISMARWARSTLYAHILMPIVPPSVALPYGPLPPGFEVAQLP